MDYNGVSDFCRRDVMKSLIEKTSIFYPSIRRQLRFNFNFNFRHSISDWMVTVTDGGNTVAPELILLSSPRPSYNEHKSAKVTVGASLSDDDVRTAVEEAIGSSVERDDRRHLIEIALRQYRYCRREYYDRTAAYEYSVLRLNFWIPVEHRHVYVVDSDYPRMVPAADSSFRLLEKHEVEEEDQESRCSICLEEFGSVDGALRMPCMHVFHGGCIKEWLRRSHYCPLCRYQMPTHDLDLQDVERD